MRTRARIGAAFLVFCSCFGQFGHGRAQDGLNGAPDELAAFEAAGEQKWVRARELATRVVRRNAQSYIGHFVLALAQHEGEANFPVARREVGLALDAYSQQFGDPPRPGSPWRWHAMILHELADIEGDLEQHEDRLRTIDRYNALYQPRLIGERAWSLMKLRRFDEARTAATEGRASGDPQQIAIALNAFCAIEFEAGQYGHSYDACKAALDYGRNTMGGPAVVDLTNFAEAARTELRLDEAEESLREATGLLDGGYGNPWLELGELYLREGRHRDALAALREVPGVRRSRIPSMRDSDRNESMRALASFYLVAGRSADALRITSRAVVTPDRRGHNSRDPMQDRAIVALLDRAARVMQAGTVLEDGAGGRWIDTLWAHARSLQLRFEAWQSGRQVVEWLADRSRLIGIVQIGLSNGGITPPWLVSDLTDILGPAAFRQVIVDARATDSRPLAKGYYDAMEAESWLASGDETKAVELARRALGRLPAGEGLLVARLHVVVARALVDHGDGRRAGPEFEAALASDPSVLRRLNVALPASIRGGGGGLAGELADRLSASGRFTDSDATFVIQIRGGRSSLETCLRGPSRAFGCSATTRNAREADDAFAKRAARAVYAQLFSPPLALGPRDISALEGPTRTARRPLDSVFGRQQIEVQDSP